MKAMTTHKSGTREQWNDATTWRRDRSGLSPFVREDGVIYHAYSAYARGVDGLWGTYQLLDRALKGRHETGAWLRRRVRVRQPTHGRALRRGRRRGVSEARRA
jgi:predicted dithiol-disulfide oxidoreductase (DUF899 family)